MMDKKVSQVDHMYKPSKIPEIHITCKADKVEIYHLGKHSEITIPRVQSESAGLKKAGDIDVAQQQKLTKPILWSGPYNAFKMSTTDNNDLADNNLIDENRSGKDQTFNDRSKCKLGSKCKLSDEVKDTLIWFDKKMFKAIYMSGQLCLDNPYGNTDKNQ